MTEVVAHYDLVTFPLGPDSLRLGKLTQILLRLFGWKTADSRLQNLTYCRFYTDVKNEKLEQYLNN